MTHDDRRSRPSSHSVAPTSHAGETGWDDETVPGFEASSFDRVTAIPDLPPEVFAKRLMAEAMENDPPSPLRHDLAPALISEFAGPSTAPPPTMRAAPSPLMDVEDEPQETAVAPRGQWERAMEKTRELDEPPASLDLDLSGFDSPVADGPDPLIAEMNDRYAMGDFTGALSSAEALLEKDPEHADALRFAKNCRETLTSMYSARLGSMDQVVTIGVPGEQIRWLSLDHRAGFLLSLVDGTSTLEEILDISGMPKLDALKIMVSLLSERVIALQPRD